MMHDAAEVTKATVRRFSVAGVEIARCTPLKQAPTHKCETSRLLPTEFQEEDAGIMRFACESLLLASSRFGWPPAAARTSSCCSGPGRATKWHQSQGSGSKNRKTRSARLLALLAALVAAAFVATVLLGLLASCPSTARATSASRARARAAPALLALALASRVRVRWPLGPLLAQEGNARGLTVRRLLRVQQLPVALSTQTTRGR